MTTTCCSYQYSVNKHRLGSFVPIALDNRTAALFERIGVSSGFVDSYGVLAWELDLCQYTHYLPRLPPSLPPPPFPLLLAVVVLTLMHAYLH